MSNITAVEKSYRSVDVFWSGSSTMFHQALGSRKSCVYLCADPTKALLPPWLDAGQLGIPGDPWGSLGIPGDLVDPAVL